MPQAPYPTVSLLPGHERRVRQGHPWVYSNELRLDAAAKALPPGTLVWLAAADGRGLGVASFNAHSLIAARRYTVDDRPRPIDRAFLQERLGRALALRQRLFPQPCYRLIHAEADGLPGLVIDRFGSTLVIQANAAGIDALEADLLGALDQLLAPETVILRNDTPARTLEGLNSEVRVVRGQAPAEPVVLEENGARYFADVVGGQKTGWFYDQREHRAFIADLARGGRVLDLYCFSGSFGVLAAARGAAAVTLIDRSQPALELAARAAAANGVSERCQFLRGEAFEELERLQREGQRFEVVITDPPPFARSKKDLPTALKAYRKLARLSARVTAPGGILLLASCSHNVESGRFAAEIAAGLADAGRSGRVLRSGGAGPDHPVHPLLPESAYLKAEVLQID